MTETDFRQALAVRRERFRVEMKNASANFEALATDRKIGVVLSGGGARGAYEAGALLAFQDAQVPTHIIAATSVGSINAASYAAHTTTLVGNAEPLIESWNQVTAATVGIDWSRYVFMLAGLVAATAGIFNALEDWFRDRGIFLHSHHPLLTWASLAAAGACLLLLYDQLPYIVYVISNQLRGGRWKPDRAKALRSLGANVLVWGFVYLVLRFTHLHFGRGMVLEFELNSKLLLLLLMFIVAAWWFLVRDRISALSHRFLRLPLHSGLFPNYERTKFLRAQIPADGLRRSPIRVIMTATDLAAGDARYFTNANLRELLRDPQVNHAFVNAEVEQAHDLVQAVVASSAFTIAYEAVPMQGRSWTDGGVVAYQPIRPAVRLGADILFLITAEPSEAPASPELKTFLDVGLRALDILMTRSLKADLKLLGRVNALCERYAKKLNLPPEQVEVQVGEQKIKFIKAFTVCPQAALPIGSLDFGSPLTYEAMLRGYEDAVRSVARFQEYARCLPASETRISVKLVPEELAAMKAATT
jgi:predicted acylesterase/phospholipase RssA